jgi:hypothetical protein
MAIPISAWPLTLPRLPCGGGGGNNVSGRYSSRKMGVTIQCESHRVEFQDWEVPVGFRCRAAAGERNHLIAE